MFVKIHKKEDKRIVAVCDQSLIGKVLEDDDICMDLDTFRHFYIGTLSKKEDVKKALDDFNSANLVGENAVNVAIHMNLVKNSDINYINGVPYIQLYKI